MDICVLAIFTQHPYAATHIQLPRPPPVIPVATSTTSESIPSLTGLHPGQTLQGEPDLVTVIHVVSCYLSACCVWTAERV